MKKLMILAVVAAALCGCSTAPDGRVDGPFGKDSGTTFV